MAATVLIREKNTVSETPTDKTSGTIRFKNADNATVDSNDRMVIPATGQDYSYEKWLQLNVTGTFTDLTNLKFYTDGANGFGTGVKLWAKTEATFTTPAEATATAGYTDAFTYTSGSALSLGSGPYTATGDIGNYLVMMLEVESTASPGTLSAETLTFSYDET